MFGSSLPPPPSSHLWLPSGTNALRQLETRLAGETSLRATLEAQLVAVEADAAALREQYEKAASAAAAAAASHQGKRHARHAPVPHPRNALPACKMQVPYAACVAA
jgi:hypothetical protein